MAVFTSVDDAGSFFNSKIYAGTGSSNAVTGIGFQPDIVWIKNVPSNYDPVLFDSVRGAEEQLIPATDAGDSTESASLTAFGADGFTVNSSNKTNRSSDDFSCWCWKAGTTSGLTGGTLTPSGYSFNTTSGVGIYVYTGTGSNATIPHGLGQVPTFIAVKSTSNTEDWSVYQGPIGYNAGATAAPGTIDMTLNDANARTTSSTMWNNTDATSSVFAVGTNTQTNNTAYTYVAYVFCDTPGFSKSGKYKGVENTDGPCIYTGFEPAFVMIKDRDSGGPAAYGWTMTTNTFGMSGDTSADPSYNMQTMSFFADQNVLATANVYIDFLSNGFKVRASGGPELNGPEYYMYLAFARNPFVNSSGVPGNAR